jgi:ribosomal protein S19
VIEKKRNQKIQPQDIDKKYKVHNGNSYKEIFITPNHVGYKFGEFALTKVPAKFKKSK